MTPISHRPYFTLPEASCVMPGPTMEDLNMTRKATLSEIAAARSRGLPFDRNGEPLTLQDVVLTPQGTGRLVEIGADAGTVLVAVTQRQASVAYGDMTRIS